MDEKTMVNDILNNIKTNLNNYQNVITQTEDINLRQTIQQIRNNDESFLYELNKVAQIKGYYNKNSMASQNEIQNVKNELQ